jgi:hypothetical protein
MTGVGQSPCVPHAAGRGPVERPAGEPRRLEARTAELAAPQDRHAGFDADLNPIDDEFINTHGSER